MFQEHITVAAFTMGFMLSLGLMFAVGPQSLKVVRAGMGGEYVTPVVLLGWICENVLLVLALVLAGTAVAQTPLLGDLLRIAGVYFLLFCAGRLLMALRAGSGDEPVEAEDETRLQAVRSLLVVTWLNPLSYAQVLFLVGVLTTTFAGEAEGWFALGFSLAAALRFYAWGLVGRMLAGSVARPRRRLIFEIGAGSALIVTAAVLAVPAFSNIAGFGSTGL